MSNIQWKTTFYGTPSWKCWGDTIEVYKYLRGLYTVDSQSFLQFSNSNESETRGHVFKLRKRSCKAHDLRLERSTTVILCRMKWLPLHQWIVLRDTLTSIKKLLWTRQMKTSDDWDCIWQEEALSNIQQAVQPTTQDWTKLWWSWWKHYWSPCIEDVVKVDNANIIVTFTSQNQSTTNFITTLLSSKKTAGPLSRKLYYVKINDQWRASPCDRRRSNVGNDTIWYGFLTQMK